MMLYSKQKVSQSDDKASGRNESSRRTQHDNLLSTLLTGNRQKPGPSLHSRTVTNYRTGERHGGPQTIAAVAQ